MKKGFQRGFSILSICIAAVAIVLLGIFYFRYISQRIYEDSTSHLVEIYSQVNHSFGAFVEKNWGILDSLRDYIHMTDDMDSNEVSDFVDKQQEYWEFSEFYFISEDGSCMTPDGNKDDMVFEGVADSGISQGEPIIVGETLATGQAVTLFAIPVQKKQYKGFEYSAIAITYNNEDMVNSLNVDAFSGKSKCFVTDADGGVLLSTQSGGSVFSNYLTYLRAGSDLDEQSLSQIHKDWVNGVSGVVPCQIGGVKYYISYQPVGYQNFILLGVVPESVASAGLLRIQKGTIDVLIKIFLLLGIVVVAHLVYSNRRQVKENKMELQYRELMFNVLSNSVEDIFVILGKETWRVDYISTNVERLLGITPEEVRENVDVLEESAIGDNVIISRRDFIDIPINDSRSWEQEHMHQSTGERRWYRVTAYHESIQGVEKFVVVMSDRTEERQMNRKLQEALEAAKSANKAKSHFLSNMSHDIRTPMNAIIGFSVLLAKDAEKPEKVRDYTRKITASSHHLLSLINDVLDMSKIESGKTSLNLAEFSLPELLEELNTILLPQAKAKKQSFETHAQGILSEQLMGDKLRINQILINLLSNAIKYTPENGKIDFLVEELPRPSAQFARLRFVIQDNGIGMSEEFQKSVFDPFSREISSTTNAIQGTGLGMAITKNLVELMGGIIHVTSQTGKGSTFTVELSFALPEKTEEKESWLRQKISRVLVADDEEEVCHDIQEMMRDTGVEVSYVTTGAAAVDAAALAKERGEEFHVILLDWKMPGLNGVETVQRIREKVGAGTPILILTSYEWEDIEGEAREAGVDAFMSKPFFVTSFWQALAPLFSDDSHEVDTKDNVRENVLEGLLFLVAEDIEMNAEILSEMLGMEGAQCEFAVNGKEALEMFVKSQPGHYDMILMDVQMPIMNGYEATRQIRACGHPEADTIPIVAMTANAFAEDVQNALDSGMNHHLAKPIDMDALKNITAQLINTTE